MREPGRDEQALISLALDSREIISGYCVKTLNFKMAMQPQLPSEDSYEEK